jgi:hypothetical protein
MKIHTPIFTAAILGILVLSACEAGTVTPTPATSPSTQATGTQQPVTSTGTANIQPAVTSQEYIAPAAVISEADNTAYNGATGLLDATYCDKISDTDLAARCKQDVQDQKYYNDAISTKDTNVCGKITNKDKKSACEIGVSVAMDRVKAASDAEKNAQDQADLMNGIVTAGDIAKCKDLTDVNFERTCEVNILVKKGLSTSDTTVCDSATTEEAKTMCQDNLKQAM